MELKRPSPIIIDGLILINDNEGCVIAVARVEGCIGRCCEFEIEYTSGTINAR